MTPRLMTPDDDRFHPVADPDPMWTETMWWGFLAANEQIGGMIYAFFRPNLGVATLVTHVWDADDVEPWRAPYARSLWHLPMPDGDLDGFHLGPLTVSCAEPLTSYRLDYDDGDSLRFGLDVHAAMDPHVVIAEPALGHFDQLCRVAGDLTMGPTSTPIDCLAVRDRSWYVRDDFRSARAGYTYGAVDADEHFLAYSKPTQGGAINGGYLVRDGQKADLRSGTRRVLSRRRDHPDEIEIVAIDALDRELTVTGRITASIGSQSTPGMFAWMSIAAWTINGRAGHGEDHEVWSPDHLAAEHRERRSNQ